MAENNKYFVQLCSHAAVQPPFGGGWCVPIMGLCSLVLHNPLCQVSRHHGNYMLNKQHGGPEKGGLYFQEPSSCHLCVQKATRSEGAVSPRVRAGPGPRNPATLSVGINPVKCSHETQSRAVVFKLFWNTKGTAKTSRYTRSHILTE